MANNTPEKKNDLNQIVKSNDFRKLPYSELESLVNYDMYVNGLNPANKEDIEKYWKERLS